MQWEKVNRRERVSSWDREHGRPEALAWLHSRHEEARAFARDHEATSPFLASIAAQKRALSDRQVEAVLRIKSERVGRAKLTH